MLNSSQVYEFKSQQYLGEIVQWLQAHKADFEVQNKNLSNWMPVDNFRDLVDKFKQYL